MNLSNNNLKAAAAIAREFASQCDDLLKASQDDHCRIYGTAASGALRRKSMDLTRALAELRKPYGVVKS